MADGLVLGGQSAFSFRRVGAALCSSVRMVFWWVRIGECESWIRRLNSCGRATTACGLWRRAQVKGDIGTWMVMEDGKTMDSGALCGAVAWP